MSDYIEREKVYNMLDALGGCGAVPDTWETGWDRAFDEAIRELDGIPAADVRRVRHGEWLLCDDNLYECSECGEVAGDNFYKFCPNCGTKMNRKE